MNEERGETIDLAYIGRALRRLTDEVARLRDDMRVLTASVIRHENTFEHHEQFLSDMVREITSLVRQHDHDRDRLRMIEDRADRMEDWHRAIREQLRAIDTKLDGTDRKSSVTASSPRALRRGAAPHTPACPQAGGLLSDFRVMGWVT